MAFQIYDKQKNYQQEYDQLLARCEKLEEDLAQSRRDMNIWIENSRAQDMKVIGLQRTVIKSRTPFSPGAICCSPTGECYRNR
eukprot:6455658-Amphidinium_carterae.1